MGIVIPAFLAETDFAVAIARPKISEVVEDTKILLQQSREKLVITLVLLCRLTVGFVLMWSEGGCRTIFRDMTRANTRYLSWLVHRPGVRRSSSASQSQSNGKRLTSIRERIGLDYTGYA